MKELRSFLSLNLAIIMLFTMIIPVSALAESGKEEESILEEQVIDPDDNTIVEQSGAVVAETEDAVSDDTIVEESEESQEEKDELSAETRTTRLALLSETANVDSGMLGDAITWSLDADGVLTLTGSGEMPSMSYKSYPWYAYRSEVHSLVVGEGITSIGASAFQSCFNLTDAVLPNSLTRIEYNAFFGCTALESLSIGGGITNWGSNVFYDCPALTSVNVNEYEVLCSDGYEANIPSTATITYLDIAPDEIAKTWCIGTYDETDVEARLYGDGTLDINGMGTFKQGDWVNSRLKTIIVSDGITGIPGNAFSGAYRLSSVSLGRDVRSIGYSAFYNCAALETIELPDGLTEIGNQAFDRCLSIREIGIPNTVTQIGYNAFCYCTALESVDLPDSLSQINSRLFYGCTSLRKVIVPDSVKRIDAYSFSDCTALTEATIGTGTQDIFSSAFSGCTALTDLYWNALRCNDLGVNSTVFARVGRAGDGVTMHIGKSVTRIPAYLFYTSNSSSGNEPNLKAVEAPADGALKEIGAFAFYRCVDLERVDIGNALQTVGEGAFNSCGALASVRIPSDTRTIGRKAFFRTALTDATILSTNVVIGESAFAECGNALTISGYAGSTVQTYAAENGIPFAALEMNRLTLFSNSKVGNIAKQIEFPKQSFVSLSEISEETQVEYYAYASDAELVAWNTLANGGGAEYERDAELVLSQDMSLYAQWRELQPVIIYLDGNHDKIDYQLALNCYETNPIDLTEYSLDVQGLLSNAGETAKVDCWTTEPDGGGRSYTSGEWWKLTLEDDGLTLYAQWKDETILASGVLGGQISWVLDANGRLLLTGNGAMPNLERENYPWYRFQSAIQSVVVGGEITSVGENAFNGYYQLQTLQIGDHVDTINDWAFADCYQLSDITFGKGLREIDNRAFISCNALTDIALGDQVTRVGSQAFDYCHALQSVSIGSGIETIENRAFYSSDSLQSVTIDSYAMCVDVQDNSFSNGVTPVFREADAETVVRVWEIGAYDESDVTATLYADGMLVISGEGEFNKMPWTKQITSLVVENGITGICGSAFRDCRELTSVELGKDVQTIEGYAFSNCVSLNDLKLSDGMTRIYYGAFRDCFSLQSVEIPDSVQYIENNAFYNCSAMETLTIGKSVTWIGHNAFAQCTSLRDVRWNALECGVAEYVFAGSGSKKDGLTLTIGPNVRYIPDHFFSVSSTVANSRNWLKEVAVEPGTVLNGIGASAFYGCNTLERVDLGNTLLYIDDGAFNSCTALTSITLPDSLEHIGRKAFYRSGLLFVSAGSNLVSIGDLAFAECPANLTIQSCSGSEAERYAADHGILHERAAEKRLTIQGNHTDLSFEQTVGYRVGTKASLARFSERVQAAYYAVASDASLVSWNTLQDGSGVRYEKNAAVSMDEDITLYAQWRTDRVLAHSSHAVVGSRNTGSRFRETVLGNLVSDGIRWYVENKLGTPVDAAIMNGGGLRADLTAGAVTDANLETVMPFGNTLATFRISGKDLLTALECACQPIPAGTTTFPQVSGMAYQVLAYVPYAQAESLSGNFPLPLRPGTRVIISSIGGKPFSESDFYTIATNSFLMAGGDGYYTFPSAMNRQETEVLLTDAIATYLQEGLKGNLSKHYRATENRVKIVMQSADLPVVTTSNVTIVPGGRAFVNVDLANNPGLVDLRLRIHYDSSALTLVGVTDGGVLGEAFHSSDLSAPYILFWENGSAEHDFSDSGTLATLCFDVSQDAAPGEYGVMVDILDAYNSREESIDLSPVSGTIAVQDVLMGDSNSDGTVNAKDCMTLLRYLVQWTGYEDILDPLAADADGDGDVTVIDAAILIRHLAGWVGYERLPYRKDH